MISKIVRLLRIFVRTRIGPYRVLFVIRLAQWPVRALVRPIARNIRRNPDLVAFGAADNRFADNAAYLYLHMSATPGMPRCVWITGSAEVVDTLRRDGLLAVQRWSIAGIRAALGASRYVFNGYRSDINGWLSDGAVAVNLWHGIGVKLNQRDRGSGAGGNVYTAKEGSLTARAFRDDRNTPDFMLSTSAWVTDHFSRQFAVPPEHCMELGYPRCDHLALGTAAPRQLADPAVVAPLEGRYPVVGYFPTWRDASAELPIDRALFDAMVEQVANQGGVLMFKPHMLSLASTVTSSDRVLVLPSDADLNAYLGRCDVIITDFSSVSFDFMLTGRPIVIYVPDLDEFDARGTVANPLDLTPGLLCRTADELLAALADVGQLKPAPNFERLTDLFWGVSAKPGALQRVAEFVRDVPVTSNPGK